MRFRSLMALLFISFTALGLTGCDSSDNESNFVAVGPPVTGDTGSLTFRFGAEQGQFNVDPATNTLVFEYFDNAAATGTPFRTDQAVVFGTSVTRPNVPISTRAVRITGFDLNRIPLFSVVQPVNVGGSQDTVVQATIQPTPVSLQGLQLSAAGSVDGGRLNAVDLEVNGTGQVFLIGTYSDGTEVVLGNAATYSNDPNDPDSAQILQVGQFGELRGLAPGTTNLIAQFGGQTLTIPVTVSQGLAANFSTINIANPDPISIASGTSTTVSVTGTRASDGFVFGVSPQNDNLTYQIVGDPGISVNGNGVITVLPLTPGGSDATLTVRYLNSNGSTLTDTSTVIVSGAAGVASIRVTPSTTEIFTGVVNLTSNLAVTETLTNGTTQVANPTAYTYRSSNPAVATVSATGAVTPVAPGEATITATNILNPNLTGTTTITVTSATVQSAEVLPAVSSVPASGSRAYTMTITLSNNNVVDVTDQALFTVTNTTNFAVNGNTVSVMGTPPSGTATTVTGTFDPGGNAADVSDTATLTVQ